MVFSYYGPFFKVNFINDDAGTPDGTFFYIKIYLYENEH